MGEHRRVMKKAVNNWLKQTDFFYSWIGHGLQSGPTLAFSLWLSVFKTKTSFGFLIKHIGGRIFWFFGKVEK